MEVEARVAILERLQRLRADGVITDAQFSDDLNALYASDDRRITDDGNSAEESTVNSKTRDIGKANVLRPVTTQHPAHEKSLYDMVWELNEAGAIADEERSFVRSLTKQTVTDLYNSWQLVAAGELSKHDFEASKPNELKAFRDELKREPEESKPDTFGALCLEALPYVITFLTLAVGIWFLFPKAKMLLPTENILSEPVAYIRGFFENDNAAESQAASVDPIADANCADVAAAVIERSNGKLIKIAHQVTTSRTSTQLVCHGDAVSIDGSYVPTRFRKLIDDEGTVLVSWDSNEYKTKKVEALRKNLERQLDQVFEEE